jgi:hypothetical protein
MCENCGGSVLVRAPEAESKVGAVSTVPFTKGMAKRVLKGIPGLRGWHKCRGESQLESEEDRYRKQASMITQLACLRIWHLLFWTIKGSRAHFADLYGGERGIAHGLALSGALVTSVELVDRPATTHHVRVENVQGDALKHDLSGEQGEGSVGGHAPELSVGGSSVCDGECSRRPETYEGAYWFVWHDVGSAYCQAPSL